MFVDSLSTLHANRLWPAFAPEWAGGRGKMREIHAPLREIHAPAPLQEVTACCPTAGVYPSPPHLTDLSWFSNPTVENRRLFSYRRLSRLRYKKAASSRPLYLKTMDACKVQGKTPLCDEAACRPVQKRGPVRAQPRSSAVEKLDFQKKPVDRIKNNATV